MGLFDIIKLQWKAFSQASNLASIFPISKHESSNKVPQIEPKR